MARRARRNPKDGGYDDRTAHEVAAAVTTHAGRNDTTGWAKRHKSAMAAPSVKERGIPHLIEGWLTYADAHRDQLGSPIGEDYVLGPAWLKIGKGIRELLNGELGRLDAGTLDGILLDVAESQGFTEEDLNGM